MMSDVCSSLNNWGVGEASADANIIFSGPLYEAAEISKGRLPLNILALREDINVIEGTRGHVKVSVH